MKFDKKNLIKSPLNYTGGKYKLLPQILPLFPKNIDIFVDLFCGSGEVAVNTLANKLVCNDLEHHVVNLLMYFKNSKPNEIIQNVDDIICKYQLSDTSKNGYEYYGCFDISKGVREYNKPKYTKLRYDYNKDTTHNLLFFVLTIFSFNNQIRFNSKGEFNMPCNHRDFNSKKKSNTIRFIDKLSKINVSFESLDFREFDTSNLTENDLLYCDPPYLITTASYNDGKRGVLNGWTEQDESELLHILDSVNNKGSRFALSNVIYHKGKENNILKEWSKKYKVHFLDSEYNNFNYRDDDSKTVEVLITNYDVD